ncbi:Organic solvent tolerance protein OstA [Planctomycetales bacterium 10988]|nr:Organic solvent tolerance protein OstA [Planctomycetales bacterium 10988]
MISTAWGVESQVYLAPVDAEQPILMKANQAQHWEEGAYQVWCLQGNCSLDQADRKATCNQAVIWYEKGKQPNLESRLIVYLEGDVKIDSGGQVLTDETWFGRYYTTQPLRPSFKQLNENSAAGSSLYSRALARFLPPQQMASGPDQQAIQQTLYQPVTVPPPGAALPPGVIRVRAFPRGDLPYQIESRPTGRGTEQATIITQGVNLLIDGVQVDEFGDLGTLDLLADRMVIWTQGGLDLSGQTGRNPNQSFEVYLEGNIVFRQGPRVVYAKRMYYDITNRSGIILDAELLSPATDVNGLVRIKADVIQQVSQNRFLAKRAWFTTSLLSRPKYRWQAGEIELVDQQQNVFDPVTGLPVVDPESGQPVVESNRRITMRNNFLFLSEVPIFYWPVISARLEDPGLILEKIAIRNDDLFGTQVLTTFNMYELLGVQEPPAGSRWLLNLDYLSDRGPAVGTELTMPTTQLFGMPAPGGLFLDAWAIRDTGFDNLGLGRQMIAPEEEYRYRIFEQSRQYLNNEYRFTTEVGLQSDRNFLEQYFEPEFDNNKDQETGLELWKATENRAWSLSANVQVNDFYTQTQWLPRFDYFWLGESLFNDTFTAHSRLSVGYADLSPATFPQDPVQAAAETALPWEADAEGGRYILRSELDYPLQAGPVKMVPYVLGEAAHWDEDLTGGSLDRLYYQAGVRASLPIWATFPEIQSDLFNVDGVAHKISLETDAYFAEANEDLNNLPLYDNLDDDATERFRRRFAVSTFGGMTPIQFDERFYGVRSGLASSVSSSALEIAEDLTAVRMGLHQRWQTKRGYPGQKRIIDWIVFDIDGVFFPEADRDNFGESFGLLTYDFRWHVGDRLTLFSDGAFDFFDTGQEVVSVGMNLDRIGDGNLLLEFSSLGGPFNREILTGAYSYRMTEKWASSYSLQIDFGNDGLVTHTVGLVRIGESFIVSLGYNFNNSKDTSGVTLLVEPRFSKRSNLSSLVPPKSNPLRSTSTIE